MKWIFVLALAVASVSANADDKIWRLEVTPPEAKTKWMEPQNWGVPGYPDSSEHGVGQGRRTTSCPCGMANRSGQRIVGGREYAAHEYPFIAGLARMNPYRPFCGGTIVSASHIVSAAHCTDGNTDPIFAVVGDYDRRQVLPGQQVVAISQVVTHPGWNARILANDLIVLVTAQPIMFSRTVSPACIPQAGLNLVGQTVRVIGWGAKGFQQPMTMKPSKVDLGVVDDYTCSNAWYGMVYPGSGHLCTHAQRKTACQGDSGGPVIWNDPETMRYTLVGAVSFGANCEDTRPSVQTNVPHFISWIVQVINAYNPHRSTACWKQ